MVSFVYNRFVHNRAGAQSFLHNWFVHNRAGAESCRVQSIRCSIILVHNWSVLDRSCWIGTVQNRAVLDRYHPLDSSVKVVTWQSSENWKSWIMMSFASWRYFVVINAYRSMEISGCSKSLVSVKNARNARFQRDFSLQSWSVKISVTFALKSQRWPPKTGHRSL